jgi:hypothetical protein
MTRTHSASSGFKRMTNVEAVRALYIDFEGEKGQPPVLLGLNHRGGGTRPRVHQVLLDPAFAPLGLEVRPLHRAIELVVRRAEVQDRRIVAWSQHELGIVRTLAAEDPALVARFEARFANARSVATWWRNRVHDGDRPATNRLADYLAYARIAVPADARGGDVGEIIRLIRARLDRGLPPTDGQRVRWGNLLEHNSFDCFGMRRVCLRAAAELEAVG